MLQYGEKERICMDIITWLKAVLLGIVEGITEWLPISSTTHLDLMGELVRFDPQSEFTKMFTVVIQLGAILAVMILYFNKLNPFHPKKKAHQRKATFSLLGKIIAGSIPAVLLGLMLDDWIDGHIDNGFVKGCALIIYGVLFIVIENDQQKKQKPPMFTKVYQVDYLTALYVGFFQVLALVPGTSRSGITILGALVLGASRGVAVEFSFLLGIPILAGASLYKLYKHGLDFTGPEMVYLITGMLVSFGISMVAVRVLLNWIKTHDLKFFGYYRIVFGLVILVWFFVGRMVA